MVRIELCVLPLVFGLFLGCASTNTATKVGPDAPVPVFAAGDARVETPGFVAETLRLHHERDGIRYTLMAFDVGEKLTLGAMVRGKFAGQVHWQVGDRRLSFPFDTESVGRDIAVTDSGDPERQLVGQSASFRGTAWVNVELPLADWVVDGTSLQLTFAPHTGAKLALPDEGHHYVLRLVSR
ncbi:MAG: hypothetical protein ABIP94_02630 [Planctomycetota bacterium]